MEKFEKALNAFLRGDEDSSYLLGVFIESAKTSPDTIRDHIQLLEGSYRSGKFPLQLYEKFKAESELCLDDGIRTVLSNSAQVITKGAFEEDKTHTVALTEKDEPDTTKITAGRGNPDDYDSSSVLMIDGHHINNIEIGDTLKNRFVLEEILGKGGMGVVYKALDKLKVEADDKDPYVAVKVLNENFKKYPQAFVVFQREARKAQKLAHPNIVNVFDFDRDEASGTIYMTMEILKGEPLDKILHQAYPSALPLQEGLSIVKGMAEALRYAHQHHIVHSDFKPGNIFVASNGNVKVLDFGIARVTRSANQENDDRWMNTEIRAFTPRYASCDMLENANPDPRDDIYALAVITYEIITGRHPFNRDSCLQARERKLVPDQPKNLTRQQWKGLQNGFAFDRKARTSNVTEFLQQLDLLQKTHVVRKNLLAAFAGIALVAIGLYSYEYFRDDPLPEPGPIPDEVRAEVEKHLSLSELGLETGDMEGAFFSFQKVLELHPYNKTASTGLEIIAEEYAQAAKTEFEKGNREEAKSMVEAGLKANPDHKILVELLQKIQ